MSELLFKRVPADGVPPYAELHCLTHYTFLRGASSARELFTRATELGYSALAITDECSLAGVVQAWQAANDLTKDGRLPPLLIVGSEFTLTCGLKIVLLAQSRDGYGNLSALITLARRRCEKGTYRLERGDFLSITPSGAIPDCLVLWLPLWANDEPLDRLVEDGLWLADHFPGRLWIGVELMRGPDDQPILDGFTTLSTKTGIPLVAAGDVHMHVRERRRLQDTMTAIRLRTTVFDAGMALYPNAERHLRPRKNISRLYPPRLLEETLKVAARCCFDLGELRYEYPGDVVPHGVTYKDYLRQITEEGLKRRYPRGEPPPVRKQVESELSLIEELKFEPYFLTVYDIVAFARSRRILCQGRGSAANSAVCYAIGITEVDPAHSSLLFERFISRERKEPPDIDVDFEHERREEVIQYLYTKYGRERAALTAAVTTYHVRGAVRDVGRALGFGEAQLSALARSMTWWEDDSELNERLRAIGLKPESPRIQKWVDLTHELVGAPRHLSQHSGGLVLSRGPLSRLVPIENAAMEDRSVIQWDKNDLDALGILKVDVLALGMLTAIRKGLEGVSSYLGREMRMQDIPAEDPGTYEMIQRAETTGVFQIESRAQQVMLPRMKPTTFYDLVIEVALVRPGPIQGDMVNPYLMRRQGKQPVTYPSEAVREVTERTLGIPVFQEQAMKLSMVAAGFSGDEADRLRRAMAAWRRRGGLGEFEQKLRDGMRANGYSDEFAGALYRQLQGFAAYGFPESHAASFALLVYASAWLKCHHPAAFLCALLNSQPMGFYSPSSLVQDAQRNGVRVLPVDANASAWDSALDLTLYPRCGFPSVRLGLRMIAGLARETGERIASARNDTPYASLDDLIRRARPDRKALNLLAQAGAFSSLAGHRRQATWEAASVRVQGDLFDGLPPAEETVQILPATEGQDIVADYSALGLTLGRHPLALLRANLARQRFLSSADCRRLGDRALARVAGLVTCRQRPETAQGVLFVTLEDEAGLTNVVIWNNVFERFRSAALNSSLLGIYGQVQRDGEVIHLIAQRLVDLSHELGTLQVSSRDFH